jgi:hypothetical protein
MFLLPKVHSTFSVSNERRSRQDLKAYSSVVLSRWREKTSDSSVLFILYSHRLLVAVAKKFLSFFSPFFLSVSKDKSKKRFYRKKKPTERGGIGRIFLCAVSEVNKKKNTRRKKIYTESRYVMNSVFAKEGKDERQEIE